MSPKTCALDCQSLFDLSVFYNRTNMPRCCWSDDIHWMSYEDLSPDSMKIATLHKRLVWGIDE